MRNTSHDKRILHQQAAVAVLAALISETTGAATEVWIARAAVGHADNLLAQYEAREESTPPAPPSNGFLDVLNDWKEHYFAANPDAHAWEGSSFQLQKAIMADPRTHQTMRPYDVNAITRQLIALRKRGHNIESIDAGNESSFRWRIARA